MFLNCQPVSAGSLFWETLNTATVLPLNRSACYSPLSVTGTSLCTLQQSQHRAARKLVPLTTLSLDPFADVCRAIFQLDIVGLALHQKNDSISIYEG